MTVPPKFTLRNLLFLTFLSAAGFASGQELAIQGYSPVSYFTKGIAEKGSEKFAAEYKESIYYLSSQDQKDLFVANPAKYAPRFGEYCPFSLQTGMRKAIDPTSFKIVGDTLLLFHYSDQLDAKLEWNKGEDNSQIEKANGEFVLFTF
ncbi:MAG: YHS domain-containing (seleno)protein [Pseudohongiellaceae bacterium]